MRIVDDEYRKFVRSLDCSVVGCENSDIDPHHVEGRGVGTKGSDGSCIPLCREHHSEYHAIGARSFERKHNLDLAMKVAETLHHHRYGRPIRFPHSIIEKAFEHHA